MVKVQTEGHHNRNNTQYASDDSYNAYWYMYLNVVTVASRRNVPAGRAMSTE